MKSHHVVFFFVLVAMMCGMGCESYQTTKMSELEQRHGKGPIRILTVDSLLYTLNTFIYTDSTLSGAGVLKRNGETRTFEGTIPFSRILFIERFEFSLGKAAWAFPMAVWALKGVTGPSPSHFVIRRPHRGGSCPFIYAFDGREFKLEGEAFGTSVSKSLEARTLTLLPSLTSANDKLVIRVSNERPETHILNNVQLFAGDSRQDSSVVLDIDNTLWPVVHAFPPRTARDHSGRDALHALAKSDGYYWKSDLARTTPFSGFRDRIAAEFDIPAGGSEATLIIRAINTNLINEVYRAVGEILGDATLQFYRALEEEPELQNTVREWIRESSLRIEIERRGTWEEIGTILPEATMVSFSRAIRLTDLQNIEGPLRVRLSTMTDVWRIDALSVDFSPVQPIPIHPLALKSVTSTDGMSWKDAIASADSSYALIFPPHHLDLTFDPGMTSQMQNPVYVFAAQGYLYEWFPASAEYAVPMFASSPIKSEDRVQIFKALIQQKDIFLPVIYSKWRKVSRGNVR